MSEKITTLYTPDGNVPVEVLKEDYYAGAKLLTVKIGNGTYNAHRVSSSLAFGPHWELDRQLSREELEEMIKCDNPLDYLNDWKNYVVVQS